MATVVIIHAAEDALPGRALAEKLRQAKLNVQLEMPPGSPELHDAVKNANAVVALWSPRSVDQGALIEEVSAARGKGVIHARMQNAANPAQFKNDKSIDLTGWRGEDEFPTWRELAKTVTAKAGVAPLPPPAPRPPSGFFQPGGANPPLGPLGPGAGRAQQSGRTPQASPPRPQPTRSPPPPQAAPRRAPPPTAMDEAEPKKGGGMGMIIIAVVAVLVLGGGGFFVWNNMQASGASAAAWTNLDKTNPGAIRQFMAANPTVHHDEAQAALAALDEQSYAAAHRADALDAYQSYLREYPQGAHKLEAQGRIAELRQTQAAATATSITTSTDTTTNPDLLPPGASTTTATTAPPAGGPVPLTPSTTTTQ